jgi:FKBP-type peptidyl-prolyl cis-trans isomerase SlyD
VEIAPKVAAQMLIYERLGENMSVITENTVGIFHYQLTSSDGEMLDTSEGREPLPYLHGHGNIIPGLEREMEGKTIGDKFTVVVAPEEAYGALDEGEDSFMEVPRDALPEGTQFQKGMQLIAEGEKGEQMPVFMHDYADDVFTFTTNHPLAGVTLVFAVEVVGLRDALAVELEHGHPHGIDGTGGHHHDH